MYIPFEEMPHDARVWVYQVSRRLTDEELSAIHQKLADFCAGWNTHGQAMPTSYDIRYRQVIILSVDEGAFGASGCSIDSSVKILREIEAVFGLDILNQGKIAHFNDESEIEVNSVTGIKEIVKEGILTADSIVLNPIVRQKSDLDRNWLIAAKESWLSKFFAN